MTVSLMSAMNPALLAAGTAATPFPVREIAGHEFVEIPEGPFVMGTTAFDNTPPHCVRLPDFAIARYAESAGQFRTQAQANDISYDPRIDKLQADHPVTHVSWFDAVNYLLTALNRRVHRPIGLPTEAQWEYAARGPAVKRGQLMSLIEDELNTNQPDNLERFKEFMTRKIRFENLVFVDSAEHLAAGMRIFNGEDFDSDEFSSLFESGEKFILWRAYGTPSGGLVPEEAYYERKRPGPVDWGPDNGYGIKGMTGGVWEWVDDWSSHSYPVNTGSSGAGPYRSPGQIGNRIRVNPRGPQTGIDKGCRGHSWRSGLPAHRLVAARSSYSPDRRWNDDLGFRAVLLPHDY